MCLWIQLPSLIPTTDRQPKKGKHITGFVAETITKQLTSTGMSFLFIVADYVAAQHQEE